VDVQIKSVVSVLFALLAFIDEVLLFSDSHGDILDELELVRQQLRRHLLIVKQLGQLRDCLVKFAFCCAMPELVSMNSAVELREGVLGEK